MEMPFLKGKSFTDFLIRLDGQPPDVSFRAFTGRADPLYLLPKDAAAIPAA